MLMPSMLVELTGIVLTAILLAADWIIWDSNYRNHVRVQRRTAR
jgi:hypothetical protein